MADSPFIKNSVLYPLQWYVFDKLSLGVKKQLINLIMRIAEDSYRRGIQQGVSMERQNRIKLNDDGLFAFRYKTPLHRAPRAEDGLCSRGEMGSTRWRFDCEYGHLLQQVGLRVPGESRSTRLLRDRDQDDLR